MGALRLDILEKLYPQLKPVQGGLLIKEKPRAGEYMFGFNGQEKDNEIYGEGNSYTAMFWQYDPRIGRRWNTDPYSGKYAWQSPYVAFNNNPIYFKDPAGLEGEKPESKLSEMDLESKDTKLNIFVIGTGKSDPDPMSTLSDDDKKNPATIVLYVDNVESLDKMLGELRNTYGKEIGNVYLSSHGNPNEFSFNIGESKITQASQLDFLKDDLSDNSIIGLLSCHNGSIVTGGAKTIQEIANRLKHIVIGNQSWTSGSANPDEEIESDPGIFSSRTSKNFIPGQLNKGKFTIGVPTNGKFQYNNFVYPGGLYQGYQMRISKEGAVYFLTSQFDKIAIQDKGTISVEPPGTYK